VVFGEAFRCFVVMFFCVFGMRMRENRVMCSLFVITMFMVIGCLTMMFSGFFVMLSRCGVMLGGVLGVRH
jgi:hypothetical protein